MTLTCWTHPLKEARQFDHDTLVCALAGHPRAVFGFDVECDPPSVHRGYFCRQRKRVPDRRGLQMPQIDVRTDVAQPGSR